MARPREPMEQERIDDAITRFARVFMEEEDKIIVETYFNKAYAKSTKALVEVKESFDTVSCSKGLTRTRLFSDFGPSGNRSLTND